MDESGKKLNVEVDLDRWIPTKETTLLQIIAALLAAVLVAVLLR